MCILILSLKQICEEGKDGYSYVHLKDEGMVSQEGFAELVAMVGGQARARPLCSDSLYRPFSTAPYSSLGGMVNSWYSQWLLGQPSALCSSQGSVNYAPQAKSS